MSYCNIFFQMGRNPYIRPTMLAAASIVPFFHSLSGFVSVSH